MARSVIERINDALSKSKLVGAKAKLPEDSPSNNAKLPEGLVDLYIEFKGEAPVLRPFEAKVRGGAGAQEKLDEKEAASLIRAGTLCLNSRHPTPSQSAAGALVLFLLAAPHLPQDSQHLQECDITRALYDSGVRANRPQFTQYNYLHLQKQLGAHQISLGHKCGFIFMNEAMDPTYANTKFAGDLSTVLEAQTELRGLPVDQLRTKKPQLITQLIKEAGLTTHQHMVSGFLEKLNAVIAGRNALGKVLHMSGPGVHFKRHRGVTHSILQARALAIIVELQGHTEKETGLIEKVHAKASGLRKEITALIIHIRRTFGADGVVDNFAQPGTALYAMLQRPDNTVLKALGRNAPLWGETDSITKLREAKILPALGRTG